MGSRYKHVFEPINIRGIDFKNRLVLAPPSPNRASQDGVVTHDFVDWFRMIARGGVGIMYCGNASVAFDECHDEDCQLNLGTDKAILNLSWYAEMADAYNCHASLEINHNGKDTAPETIGCAPYSASPIITASEYSRAKRLGRDPIPAQEMTKEKIAETVGKFGDAAYRMKRAGMDICLVHGGHGNLISQFTSPLYNHRQDEYGGSLENRARFAIEVCEDIRKKCGEDFVIEFRISADEIQEEGMHFPETLDLIDMLRHHVDIFNVSAGLHSDYDMKYYRNWCQNYMMPRGYNVHFARDVKKNFPDVLVDTVGSIVSIDMAEEIISNGWSDFVAMCRPLMADPDMPKKYAVNMPEERRPCLRCDQCAMRFAGPRPLNCAVNPYSGNIVEFPECSVGKADKQRRVAIIGGGVAGMQAALTACERGHDVTIYEMGDKLGGSLIPACAPECKQDLRDYFAWILRQIDKSGAKVLLNTKATKEMLDKEAYDVIILAVGADPLIPKSIPGIDKPHVCWAPDAQMGKFEVGKKLAVIGSGAVGMEAAMEFHDAGKDVFVIEMSTEENCRKSVSKTSGPPSREMFMLMEQKKIPQHFGMRLDEICDDRIICTNMATGEKVEFECDTVLLSLGMVARKDTVAELRHCAPETEVFIVGDCKKPANISQAVNGAFAIAAHL